MKTLACLLAVPFVLLALAPALAADNPDAILGQWLNGKKTAHIEIDKANGKYFGKIVWLKEPTYPADDKKGMAGQPKVDRENPDPSLRKRPILDLVILRDFVYAGGNRWEQGRVYDPENGKDYKCKMTLTSPDTLEVRGFVGVSLFGRTETWARVK